MFAEPGPPLDWSHSQLNVYVRLSEWTGVPRSEAEGGLLLGWLLLLLGIPKVNTLHTRVGFRLILMGGKVIAIKHLGKFIRGCGGSGGGSSAIIAVIIATRGGGRARRSGGKHYVTRDGWWSWEGHHRGHHLFDDVDDMVGPGDNWAGLPVGGLVTAVLIV